MGAPQLRTKFFLAQLRHRGRLPNLIAKHVMQDESDARAGIQRENRISGHILFQGQKPL